MAAQRLRAIARWDVALVLGIGLSACGEEVQPSNPSAEPGVAVTPAPPGQPWQTLEEWHLFADAAAQRPANRVIPYDVISELYADDAVKHRFLHVPDRSQIGFQSTRVWRFPQGSILVKTFAYPRDARDEKLGERLLETRLLILGPEGWLPRPMCGTKSKHAQSAKPKGPPSTCPGPTRPARAAATLRCPHHAAMLRMPRHEPQLNTLGGRTRQLDRDFDFGVVRKIRSTTWRRVAF